MFDKARKNVPWESLFNKWCWENWKATCKRMKMDHFLTPYTHKFKMIKELNMRHETIKILEENIGSNCFDLGHRNFLLGISPVAKKTKAKINCWGCIKM